MKASWGKVRLGAIAILGAIAFAIFAFGILTATRAQQDAAQAVESTTYDMEPVAPYEFRGDVRDLTELPSPLAGPPVYRPLLKGPSDTKEAQTGQVAAESINLPFAPMPSPIQNFAGLSFSDSVAATSPAMPTNLSPGSSSSPGPTTSSSTVTLSWSASSGATSYEVAVEDVATSSFVEDSTISSTSFTTSHLSAGRQYVWNVDACNGPSNCSAFAPHLFFQTPGVKPAPPTNLSPGSSSSPGPTTSSSTVTLSWSASSGATSYEVAVEDVATSSFVEDSTISSTSFTTSHLSAGRQYVWNVDACNGPSNCSAFAPHLFFQTPGVKPAPPTNLSPGSSSSPGPTTSSSTVTLSWSASSGATSYEVAVEDVATSSFVEDSTISSTSFTTSHLSAGRQYVWNVDACNGPSNCSAFAPHLFFQTPGVKPAPPTNLSPGSSSSPGPTTSSSTVTLSWSASSGATSYEVAVEDVATSSFVEDSTISSTSFTTSHLSAGRQYVWNVDACNGPSNCSAFAPHLFFQTPGVKPAPPTNLSPGSSSSPGPTTSSSTVTLSWSASSGATSYEVAVEDVATSSFVEDSTISSTSFTTSHLSAGRQYVWNVDACNGPSNCSAFAPHLFFQTPGVKPAPPTNLSPGSSSSPGPTTSSSTVTLSWSASSGATSYEVAVEDVATSSFVEDSTISSTSFTTSHLSAGRQYVWNVDACNGPSNCSAFAPHLFFQTPGTTTLGILSFPLHYCGWTPYTAQITTVFDHATTGPYQPGGGVVAYTGESGTIEDPNEPPVDFGNGLLYSFKKADGSRFVVNGNYVGTQGAAGTGPSTLNYDGHPGYDFPVPIGTDVFAAADGEIVVADPDSTAAGNYIRIQHGNSGYQSEYLHLSQMLVSVGDTVTRGQLIGLSGNTAGPAGTVGPHLHFQVKQGTGDAAISVDPYGWEGTGADPYTLAVNVNLWNPPSTAAPSITGVSPNPVTGSSVRQTITISGANFLSKPTVTLTWTVPPLPPAGGYVVPTAQVTYVSDTQVQMSVTTTLAPDRLDSCGYQSRWPIIQSISIYSCGSNPWPACLRH